MKNYSLKIMALLFSFTAFAQQESLKKDQHRFVTTGKKITVYTTADSTKFRLTPTDNLVFVPADQHLFLRLIQQKYKRLNFSIHTSIHFQQKEN